MKVTIKATAILLLLLAAGPSALTAQQGKESMKMDTSSMSRMHGMHRGMVHEWGTRPDSMNMKMRGMKAGNGTRYDALEERNVAWHDAWISVGHVPMSYDVWHDEASAGNEGLLVQQGTNDARDGRTDVRRKDHG